MFCTGTYNELQGAISEAACIKCPLNSFNNETGQASCSPCGGSAVSRVDSLACECRGNNRVFMAFDAACRCRPGYTIYDSVGNPVPSEAVLDGVLDCFAVVLPRCSANQIYTQSGKCVGSCPNTQCTSPPCYCDSATGYDFCNNSCPSFQIPKAERVQIDTTIGMSMVCSCECPVGSTDNRCADPDQVPLSLTYEFEIDTAGTTVLVIKSSTGSTPYLLPGLASTGNGASRSQFIGSSPSGFTGVLDAPLSFFQVICMM